MVEIISLLMANNTKSVECLSIEIIHSQEDS